MDVNDMATRSTVDLNLTRARSPDVPPALAAMSAALTAMRTRYGFDSPIGHCCSNLLEQIAILPTYMQPAWATHKWQTLPWLMSEQIKALANLTGGMH